VANPSEKALTYKSQAQGMSWDDVRSLWQHISNGNPIPNWNAGKALEHLVVRAFELSGLRVEYPYDVPPGGRILEQIDGLVYLGEIPFLIECKDKDSVDIAAIAKLQSQLLRRPPATMGAVFVSGGFTSPALILADLAVPYRILLWSSGDIELGLEGGDFHTVLRKKYEDLCMYGLTDYSPNYRALEVKDE
jgi:hypothetical protein